jgi:PAS domain-containing protein
MWMTILLCAVAIAAVPTVYSFRKKYRRLRLELDQLRASEEKLRLLVDAVLDYTLCLLDADGRVMSWNPGGERMFGYRRDDIIGRHICCLYTDAAMEPDCAPTR